VANVAATPRYHRRRWGNRLATVLSIGAAVFAAHAVWFELRVREDEARLADRFGDAYRDYCRRVKRWIPGVY